MKRKEVEERLANILQEAKSRIESAPLPAFIAGLLIGILLGLFYMSLIPLVFLIALVVGCLWLFSDSDRGSSASSGPSSPEGNP